MHVMQLVSLKKYIIVACILFHVAILSSLVPLGRFGDSEDALLGGCLISQGKVLYQDFFSHHGPLPYYWAALIYTITGTCDIMTPHIPLVILSLATIWIVYFFTKSLRTLTVLSFLFMTLALHYYLFMPFPQPFISIAGILSFLILIYFQTMPTIFLSLFFILCISFFVLASPIYIPCALLLTLFFLLEKKLRYSLLVVLGYIPSLITMLSIGIPTWWYHNIEFNFRWYQPYDKSILKQYGETFYHYIGNIVKILEHPILITNVNRIENLFELTTLLLWIIVLYRLWKEHIIEKKLLFFIALLSLFLSLHFMHFHKTPYILYVFLVASFYWKSLRWERYLYICAIFLASIIALQTYMPIIQTNNTDARLQTYESIIPTYTKPSDTVLLYPSRFDAYLTSHRNPGSYYYFLMPWIIDQPNTQEKVIADIQKNSVQLIILDDLDGKMNVFDLHLTAPKVVQFLDTNPLYTKNTDTKGFTLYIRKNIE